MYLLGARFNKKLFLLPDSVFVISKTFFHIGRSIMRYKNASVFLFQNISFLKLQIQLRGKLCCAVTWLLFSLIICDEWKHVYMYRIGRQGVSLWDVGLLCTRTEGRLCRLCRRSGETDGPYAQILFSWWCTNSCCREFTLPAWLCQNQRFDLLLNVLSSSLMVIANVKVNVVFWKNDIYAN